MMTREELRDEERREAFDEQEYEKECRREKKRLKENPPKTKVEYWFTRAHTMPKVYNKRFVADFPEPTHFGFRPSINDPPDYWDAYKQGYSEKYEWDRNGGSLTFYCPAIIKTEGDESKGGTVFLDYTHVHGGHYEHPMPQFDMKEYPRKDGTDHCIMLELERTSGLGSVVNITKDFDSFDPDLQYAILKHTKAIGEAACEMHSNRPDLTEDMVHAVRVLTTPEDGAPVSPR
jgi:hypothetical protein